MAAMLLLLLMLTNSGGATWSNSLCDTSRGVHSPRRRETTRDASLGAWRACAAASAEVYAWSSGKGGACGGCDAHDATTKVIVVSLFMRNLYLGVTQNAGMRFLAGELPR